MKESNITNYNSGNSEIYASDEYTPLLKDSAALQQGKYGVSEASSVTEVDPDVESAECLSDAGSKVEAGSSPRDIAGVISILLLGKYFNLLSYGHEHLVDEITI